MIKVDKLYRQFSGKRVLSGIDYSFETGAITGIIGRNGSGKSTLLNCMAGQDLAYLGRIKLHERDVSRYPRYKMAQLGVIKTDQEPGGTISLTLRDMIELSEPLSSENGCCKLANQLIAHLPNDLQFQPLNQMSFGQRKIANLALALMHEPKVLLLDEPIGGLSYDIIDLIGRTLIECRKLDLTTIVIEHDFDFLIKFADFALLINDENVAATGEAKSVLTSKSVLKAFK